MGCSAQVTSCPALTVLNTKKKRFRDTLCRSSVAHQFRIALPSDEPKNRLPFGSVYDDTTEEMSSVVISPNTATSIVGIDDRELRSMLLVGGAVLEFD
jgi:hypothetical protein